MLLVARCLSRAAKVILSEIRHRYWNPSRGYYYERIETTARVTNCGANWNTLRRAKVIALQDGVSEIELGVAVPQKNNQTLHISPATLQLTPFTRPASRFENYKIIVPRPVKKGDAIDYEFAFNFTKTPPHSDRLAWSSGQRVDTLVLRVVFDKKPTTHVKMAIVDASEVVIHEKNAEIDPVTFEVRWEISSLKRNLTYQLVWFNNDPLS